MRYSFTKMLSICCGLVMLFGATGAATAQSCLNSSRFPSATEDLNNTTDGTNITGAWQVVAGNQWTTEYTEFTGFIAGNSYTFEINQGADGSGAAKYITVRSDSLNGPVIAEGASPLSVSATGTSNLFVHWNEDAACGTQQISHRTRVINSDIAAVDCLGVLGGPAQPGTACNDGDPLTTNDTWQTNCECQGESAQGNEICANAVNVSCGTVLVDSTTNAAPDVAPFCGTSDGTGGGRWYRFATASLTEAVISTCADTTNFDTKIRVYEGTCDSLICVGGNDDDFTCSFSGTRSTVTFNAQPATLYYILVHGFSSAEGTYELSITCNDFECPGLGNIGDACDDNDETTFDDVITEACVCEGTPFDCPTLLANIGDPCDAAGELGEISATCECLPAIFDGCTNGIEFGSIVADCEASTDTVSFAFVNEFTTITGISAGTEFTFSVAEAPDTIPTFYITITDDSLNVLAFGEDVVTYTATSNDDLRFYTHSTVACSAGGVTGFESVHLRVVDWVCNLDCPELGANIGDPCLLPAAGLSPFLIEVDSVLTLGSPITYQDSVTFEVPAGSEGIYDLTVTVNGVAQNGNWISEFRVRITSADGVNITDGAPGGNTDEWQPAIGSSGGPINGSFTFEGVNVTAGTWILETRFSFDEGATVNGINDFDFQFDPLGELSTVGPDCQCTPLEPVCEANGGTLVYEGSNQFCSGTGTGSANSADVSVVGASGTFQRWGLFDSSGNLVANRGGDSQFNLTTFAPGTYTIRYLRYEADVDITTITSLASFGTLEGCWSAASNAITVVVRPTPNGGTLTALSPTTVCADAGSSSTLQLGLSGFSGDVRRYGIASVALGLQVVAVQVGSPTGATFNLNGLPAGTYRAAAVAAQTGTSLAGVQFVSDLEGCYDLSNLVSFNIVDCAAATLASSPNPTGGQSFVSFTNPREEYATLEVYDMSGRMIEQLFNQVTNPGQEYRLEFDGNGLPNGVYLYRLTTASEVIVDKFMIAR